MDVAMTWWWLTTIILLFETVRDMKTMRIDERHIYLLFGYTLFLAIYLGTGFLEIVGFSLAAAIILASARKVLARGDQMILFNLLLGHHKTGSLILFVLTFTFVLIGYLLGVKIIAKKSGKAPAVPLLTVAHLLTIPAFF